MNSFKVNPQVSPLEFFFNFRTAREMYVTARVCLQNGLVEAGQFLAHQSIEIMTKGIMRLNPEYYYAAPEDDPAKKGMASFWGHSLSHLIGIATVRNTKLNEIMRDSNIQEFLKELTKGYDAVRYGEAGYSAQTGNMVQLLDKAFLALDNAYLNKVLSGKVAKTTLIVPKSFRDDFRRDNKSYSDDNISDSPLGNNPGVTATPFPR